MSDKSLKSKAIDIKGKKYVLVSDRIIYFNEQYPGGSITTDLVSDSESDQIIIKATIYPRGIGKVETQGLPVEQMFTGYSQAIKGDGFINKTAALENAETSAVGRALAMMGIGVIDSVASVDEINKAQGSTGQRATKYATQKQIEWMLDEAEKKSGTEDVHKWVENLLTIPVNQVPIYKVQDAIALIRKQGKELPTIDIDITAEDEKKLKEGTLLDDLPY